MTTPKNEIPVPVSSAPTVPATAGLCEGCTIQHQRFGIGKVVKLEGTGENLKATVVFRNTGTKQLLVKFAKFTVIENG